MHMGCLNSVLNPSPSVEWNLKMTEESSHLRSTDVVLYTALEFAYFTCYRNPPWLYSFFSKIGFLLLIAVVVMISIPPLSNMQGYLGFMTGNWKYLIFYSFIALILVILQFSIKMQD